MNYKGCFETIWVGKVLHAVAWLISPKGETIWEYNVRLSNRDRNQGAYQALLALVEEVVQRKIRVITFLGSNSLVLKQVSGEWRAKRPMFYQYCVKIRSLLSDVTCDFLHLAKEKEQRKDSQPVIPQVVGGESYRDDAAFVILRLLKMGEECIIMLTI